MPDQVSKVLPWIVLSLLLSIYFGAAQAVTLHKASARWCRFRMKVAIICLPLVAVLAAVSLIVTKIWQNKPPGYSGSGEDIFFMVLMFFLMTVGTVIAPICGAIYFFRRYKQLYNQPVS